MLQAKRAEIIFGLYPNCDILGVPLSQMKSTIFSNEFVWGQDGIVWGQLHPRGEPLPGYVTRSGRLL